MHNEPTMENKDRISPEAEENAQQDPVEAELNDAETAEAEPVSSLEVQLTEARDQYLRLSAEFDNYRKRVERDRKDLIQLASKDMLSAILPVVDDFDRAMKSISEAGDSASEGVKLIHQKLRNILESKGVKPIDAAGKPFDTNFHEAIAQVPAPSEDQKGVVIDEVVKGYFLHDKVLRYSGVIVGV